ncbi:ABC transporter [Leptolyngbya sp. 15MV]|nr:ABC transporter [Leptolyngbya sp. 15MV]
MTAVLQRLLGRLPIGWLQLRHNRTRLLAALAGVAFANLLVFVQLGFLGALTGSIGLPYRAFDADILIQGSDANTLQDGSPIPRQRLWEAMSVPGVAFATAVYTGRIDWKQPDGSIRTMDVIGVDPRERVLRSPDIEARREWLMVAQAAMVDRGTRNVPPALFDSLDAGEPYRIESGGRQIDLIGSFRVGGGFGADGYMVMSDQSFLRHFGSRSAGAPSLVLIRAEPGVDHAALAARINAAMSEHDAVARPIEEAIRRDQTFQTTQRPVGIVFGFGVLIGALVGAVITYQILATDVSDHLKEYATFKAVGYPHRFFLSIVFEQAVILGVLGFIPGVLAALGFYAIVAAITGLPLAMTGTRLVGLLVGTVAMCAVSGALATQRHSPTPDHPIRAHVAQERRGGDHASGDPGVAAHRPRATFRLDPDGQPRARGGDHFVMFSSSFDERL